MSAKGFNLVQDGHFCDVLRPVSANAAQAGTRFNMALYSHVSIVLRLGAAGGPTGVVTVNIFKSFSGGSGVAIPYRFFTQNSATAPFDVFGSIGQATASGVYPNGGFSPSDIAGSDLIIELDAADLLIAANGTYVELDIAAGSLATTPQLLDAFAVLSGGRNMQDQSVSVQV